MNQSSSRSNVYCMVRVLHGACPRRFCAEKPCIGQARFHRTGDSEPASRISDAHFLPLEKRTSRSDEAKLFSFLKKLCLRRGSVVCNCRYGSEQNPLAKADNALVMFPPVKGVLNRAYPVKEHAA